MRTPAPLSGPLPPDLVIYNAGSDVLWSDPLSALFLTADEMAERDLYVIAEVRERGVPVGSPKAITATAHKLARIVYHLIRYGLAYVRQTEATYAEQVRQRLDKQLHRRAQELGYELKKVESPSAATEPEAVL